MWLCVQCSEWPSVVSLNVYIVLSLFSLALHPRVVLHTNPYLPYVLLLHIRAVIVNTECSGWHTRLVPSSYRHLQTDRQLHTYLRMLKVWSTNGPGGQMVSSIMHPACQEKCIHETLFQVANVHTYAWLRHLRTYVHTDVHLYLQICILMYALSQ